MDRSKAGGYAAAVEAAYAVIPPALHPLIQPDFLCGSDPVFAGLHDVELTEDGRSYRNTAHVVYPWHQARTPRARRTTTIVLPAAPSVAVLLHELGHVLHEQLRFGPAVKAVTWYGQANDHEAFAEAFTAWVMPSRSGIGVPDAWQAGYLAAKDRLNRCDPAAVALFARLADG